MIIKVIIWLSILSYDYQDYYMIIKIIIKISLKKYFASFEKKT